MMAGKDSPDEIFQTYKKLGYDIITISDYQSINPSRYSDEISLTAYEHGYNIGKFHQLVIGADQVEWRDFVFFKNIHHKQRVLKALKMHNAFVVLAHPTWNNAYRINDISQLTDFHAIEVFNSYKSSEQLWEHALSSGKAVWAIGNDDSQSMRRNWQTGVCWTLIGAQSNQKANILDALYKGRMIAVKGKKGVTDNKLIKCSVGNDKLTIELEQPAKMICFYGQDGVVRKIVTDKNKAELFLDPRDTYIRTEIQSEQSIMLLNPIIRFDGVSLPTYSATVNETMTWLQRTVLLFLFFLSLLLIGDLQKRKRARELKKNRRQFVYVKRYSYTDPI